MQFARGGFAAANGTRKGLRALAGGTTFSGAIAVRRPTMCQP